MYHMHCIYGTVAYEEGANIWNINTYTNIYPVYIIAEPSIV